MSSIRGLIRKVPKANPKRMGLDGVQLFENWFEDQIVHPVIREFLDVVNMKKYVENMKEHEEKYVDILDLALP